MFIKHGDGKIISIVEDKEVSEEQRKKALELQEEELQSLAEKEKDKNKN